MLTSPPEDTLFAMYSGQQDELTAVALRIKEAACSRLGLQIDSHDPEYLIWRLLEAPESGVLIEHVTTYPELERYRNSSFAPCAVLCTTCMDEGEVEGSPSTVRSAESASTGQPTEGRPMGPLNLDVI